MTSHMVTRFYRPPEVILMDDSYDSKIDIWGIGCIFFELAWVQDREENDPSNRFLFMGRSCHPLSPMKRKKDNLDPTTLEISEDDQIFKILEILGPVPKKTLGLLSKDQQQYLTMI